MNETITKELLSYTEPLKNREINSIDITELENGLQKYQVTSYGIEYFGKEIERKRNIDDFKTDIFYVGEEKAKTEILYTDTAYNGEIFFHKDVFQFMKNGYVLQLSVFDNLKISNNNSIQTINSIDKDMYHYDVKKIDLITRKPQYFEQDTYKYFEMPKLTNEEFEIVLDSILEENIKTR